MKQLYTVLVIASAAALVAFDAPSWLALAAGLAIALATRIDRPKPAKALTTWSLQAGVVALGAGMNLDVVLRVGLNGALVTATSLALAVMLGLALGRVLRVPRDTSLMLAVGTGICGGSAIAAIASVIRPKDQRDLGRARGRVRAERDLRCCCSRSIGHALGMSQYVFGRWAALAIHDTSSVVGAGLAYGSIALYGRHHDEARPRAVDRAGDARDRGAARRATDGDRRGRLRDVTWPWFIVGFVAVAALATWVPALAPYAQPVAHIGRRSLVLALFLIGLALSPSALSKVGARPFVASA